MARTPPTQSGMAGRPPAAHRRPGNRAPPRGIARAAWRVGSRRGRGEARCPEGKATAGQTGRSDVPPPISPTAGQGGPPLRTPRCQRDRELHQIPSPPPPPNQPAR
ncbi:hypothetical protein ZWY2020_000697 [Hordeum vulgare]|nr:hypothetical protein ZWY2020_000697 [Hordeum vulgare]